MLILDSDGVNRLAERSTRALALIRALRNDGLWPPIAPSVVLVESLQGHTRRAANANRFLKTCVIEPVVTEQAARRAAELRRRGHGSAVDAIVEALAEPGDSFLTGAEGVPARGDGELVQSTDVHDSEVSTGRPIDGKRSVELSSYLRSRWGVMLVVVPAIAGAIAFAAAKPPERFDAVGLVSVTPPDAIESSQFSTGPFVADFRSVLTSTAVEDAVEEALATIGAELLGSASASAGLNGGALVQVGITASTPAAAELAIRTAVAESLTVLNRQNVERAEIVAAARTAETRAAQSALTDFATVNQVQDVAGEYARRSGDLLETRNVVASNPSNSALRALLEEKRTELDRYGALLHEWQLLEDALRTAVSASGSANASLSLARARADSVGDRNLLESVAVTQAGEVTGRATAGAIGALAALAAVGLAAMVARQRNKQAPRDRSKVGPQDPPAQVAPVENGADTAPSPR